MSLEDLINQEKSQVSGENSNKIQRNEEIEELNKKIDLLLKKMREDDYEKKENEKRLKNLSIQAQKAVTEIEILASKRNNTLDFEAVGIEIEKEIRRKFSDLENEFSNTSHELEEFQERMQRTNKFFYPTLYGVFIAIVGFIVLFLLEGIMGSLFGDSYYPMIATKVEQSTGFNTFMWYLAYLAPYAVITITILAILKLFIKKGRNYL